MPVTEISCADDLAALAREALDQIWTDKRFSDLIGAVLMANHVADWYFQVDLGRKFDDAAKRAMKATYPEWDVIRQLANGTKHCKLEAPVRAKRNELQWEHDDFWGSPGHVGNDGLDWFVDYNGTQRSVAVVVKTFLEQFEDSTNRPT
ncbi:hypothetical protein [Noviherbaspirillum malthae]|uniref:hypothetical protein n=1 Tax=Noviherbaspirillum malthae TaxID=1260987 RepID=UPI00188F4BEA|nr:hypothetical protein [Noviherbaspirillum malthae]